MYSFFGGRDGSQMVEGKFCYLASWVHPWADDVQLVCARTADNLDQSLFPRSISSLFSKCICYHYPLCSQGTRFKHKGEIF